MFNNIFYSNSLKVKKKNIKIFDFNKTNFNKISVIFDEKITTYINL